MDLYHRGQFERKFILYDRQKAGSIFSSSRKCFKFSLPDLTCLQMKLERNKKDSSPPRVAQKKARLSKQDRNFISTSCERLSYVNLNKNLTLSAIDMLAVVRSTDDFQREVKDSLVLPRSSRIKRGSLASNYFMSTSLPCISAQMEGVLVCGKPPCTDHGVNKITYEKC